MQKRDDSASSTADISKIFPISASTGNSRLTEKRFNRELSAPLTCLRVHTALKTEYPGNHGLPLIEIIRQRFSSIWNTRNLSKDKNASLLSMRFLRRKPSGRTPVLKSRGNSSKCRSPQTGGTMWNLFRKKISRLISMQKKRFLLWKNSLWFSNCLNSISHVPRLTTTDSKSRHFRWNRSIKFCISGKRKKAFIPSAR